MRRKNGKISYFISIPCMIMSIFGVCIGWLMLLLVMILPNTNTPEEVLIAKIVVTIMGPIAFTLAAIFIFIPYFFPVMEFSEVGIKKTLFKKIRMREIKWEDVTNIKIIRHIVTWVFIIAGNEYENLPYNKLRKNKHVIMLDSSERTYEAIRSFSSMPIENLSLEEEQQLAEKLSLKHKQK